MKATPEALRKKNYKRGENMNRKIKVYIACLCLVILGFVGGMLITSNTYHYTYEEPCAMNTDEACSTLFDCDYGYGSMGNLRCSCDGTWKRFSWNNLEVKK